MGRINQKLKEKILESLSSVLPITAIVLALSLTVIPVPIGTLLLFLAGAVLLILGMGLFSLGAEMAMMPMGEALGARLTRTRRIGLVVVVFFAMGVIVTIAEPDLAVLSLPSRTASLSSLWPPGWASSWCWPCSAPSLR